MILGIATALTKAAGTFVAAEEFGIDDDGNVTTHHWLLPEQSEIIYGGLASLIVFFFLYKYGWPVAKKALDDRTARVQKDLDDSAADRTSAAAEATQIRTAKGDIGAERQRILDEADAHAATIVEEGRARLAAELADLEARADADIAAVGGRANDELRAEIARLSSAAVDHVVSGSLDEATQQDLIESFIARVGAGAQP
jgi:F-type H+-transporting ATPase subunit b